jgi:hypothetical protein
LRAFGNSVLDQRSREQLIIGHFDRFPVNRRGDRLVELLEQGCVEVGAALRATAWITRLPLLKAGMQRRLLVTDGVGFVGVGVGSPAFFVSRIRRRIIPSATSVSLDYLAGAIRSDRPQPAWRTAVLTRRRAASPCYGWSSSGENDRQGRVGKTLASCGLGRC